jgi:hypothetical protein
MQSVGDIFHRLRLSKLVDLFAWPDPFVLWIVPALWRAWRLTQENEYSAIVTFMMPFSTGIVGVLLKKLTGLPLVLNLNDSPTCTDMNSVFPSPLHHRLAYWLEDWFVRNADALIYVSRRNMERVRARHPADQHEKFTLIRRGVRPLPSLSSPPSRGRTFRIVYPGGMGGWYFGRPDSETPPSLLRRLYSRWQNWGKVYVEHLDPSTHSPLYVGKAGKYGRDGEGLSANLQGLRRTSTGKFARWGDGHYYHIGNLSAIIFDHGKNQKKKYEKWADRLFEEGRQLRQQTYFWTKAWKQDDVGLFHGLEESLEQLEYQIIGVASDLYPDRLLNNEGA